MEDQEISGLGHMTNVRIKYWTFFTLHHQLPSLRGDSQSPFLEVGGLTAKKEGKRVTTPSFGILTRGKTAAKPQNKVILH